MAMIQYPWHVKHMGVNYAPGELIEVEDAAEYVRGGAVIAARDAPEAQARPRRRKATTVKKEDCDGS